MNHHLGLSSGVKGQVKGRGTFQIQIPSQDLPCPLMLLKVLQGSTGHVKSDARSFGCLDKSCHLHIFIIPSQPSHLLAGTMKLGASSAKPWM